ncbi:hypothetical protein E6Q11_02215 [Candidatus Dojkabacteria bacterium]|jgi:hypothetical protein|uniref:HK97 gp10 family phage protein n=1 Tax=Candidatus Dojkabacteria bacterium TaxID=2099670 RepID=A0A5C7J8S1_9BACT|nr:MAG: hypothetical protein E6Q11_02215 [Candidatus Dojkabacteria bacterium]
MGGFKSNSAPFLNTENAVLKRTVRNMMGVTVNRAQMLAPVLTGALRSSGRVSRETGNGETATAIFGGKDVGVAYARIRHFENRKNPQTLRYLQRAGDSVVREGVAKYYKLSK